MNKIRRQVLVGGIVVLSSAPVFAQFGSLLGGSKGGASSGNLDASLSDFLGKSFRIEMISNQGALAILAAYASEEKRAEYQSKFSDIGKQTDPKEAGAKFQAVQESTDAELKKLSESNDLEAKTKAMSAEKQKLLAMGVGNFLLAALQGKDLLPSGQSLVSAAASNPMDIPKVAPVKDALQRLGNAVSLAGASIPKLVNALKGANVSVVPATATSKEEPITAI